MFELFILIIALAFVVGITINAKSDTQSIDRFSSAIRAVSEDAAALLHISSDRKSAIALDTRTGSLYILCPTQAGVRCAAIPPNAIVSAEIFEDGASVVSRSAMRTVGGALIGKALLGGAGAVVGGLSGKQRSESTCSIIELRVIVDDIIAPSYGVRFLSQEVKKSAPEYQTASTAAREWHGRIAVLIKRAEQAEEDHKSVKIHFVRDTIKPPANASAASKTKGISQRPMSQKAIGRAEQMARARQLGAERERHAKPGEHRLDID